LSCLQCRRRKLRCDRNQPSCTRCQGQGIECVFEHPPINQQRRIADNNQSHSERRADTLNSPIAIITPPQGQYAPSATIRNPTLEAPQSQGTWGLLGEQAMNPLVRERPAIMSDSVQLLEPPKPRKKENVIFRGKNFKTQFYGGSNPTSLIGDVRPILLLYETFYVLNLILASSPSSAHLCRTALSSTHRFHVSSVN
jgi:hypothetical protein